MPYLVAGLAAVVGWNWLTKPAADAETATERTTGRLIWAAGAVLGAVWAVKAWKQGG